MTTKQTFQATDPLIKQPTVQLIQTNPTIQYSDTSFNVKPTKMLSDCGGRGLRPDPPSPTGVNLLLSLSTGPPKIGNVVCQMENQT